MASILPENVDVWFEVRERFPRPDWSAIRTWIDTHADEPAKGEAFLAAARLWLERVSRTLAAPGAIVETERFLLLAPDDKQSVDELSYLLETSMSSVRDALGPLAWADYYGKPAVIVFEQQRDLVDYVSDLYPEEGQFQLGGAWFVHDGYGHIVIRYGRGVRNLYQAVVHELVHQQLLPLPLPRWLNEGLAQMVSRDSFGGEVGPGMGFLANFRATLASVGLDGFWSGDWFSAPDDTCRFSYLFSEMLVRRLGRRAARFVDFVRHATWHDAGAAAAREYLDLDLGAVVQEFFGDGDWAPHLPGVP